MVVGAENSCHSFLAELLSDIGVDMFGVLVDGGHC